MSDISKKTKNKIKRMAKNELKSTTKRITIGGKVAIILTFLIAVAGGVCVEKIITKNDVFALNGNKEYAFEIGHNGGSYEYIDEGFKVVSFGRNIADKVSVDTNMTRGNDGQYIIDTSLEGDYYIIYTVEDIKYGHIKRVRTFTVGANNE